MTRGLARAGYFVRTHLAPYAMPFFVALLGLLALFALVGVLLRPADAVVIEVVPIEDDELVHVQVAGAVATPGVYALQQGGTLQEALQLAGGTLPNADLESVDLAEPLTDGQFILIQKADTETLPRTPLDINTALASEFEALPGIGPVIAARIVAHREVIGEFTSVDELSDVSGISPRMVDELRPLVVVKP